MKRIRLICLLGIFVLVLGLMACGQQEDNGYSVIESEYVLYDLNGDKTSLVEEAYYPSDENPYSMIKEMLDLLSDGTTLSDMSRPLPDDVSVQDYRLDADTGKLTISFSRAYSTIERTLEPLVRAAFVKTLVQVVLVNSVEFEVDHTALTSSSGTTIGPMNERTFVMSMVSDEDGISQQVTTLTLYYPDASGEKLIKEQKTVTHNSNIPVTRVVMNSLQEKPETEGAKSAYGSSTSVLSISIADGVCYVNFDNSFLSAATDVSEAASVYAIVNSLTELSGVNKVYLAVDGDNLAIRDKVDGGIFYLRNEALVISEEEDSEETTEEGEESEASENTSLNSGVTDVMLDSLNDGLSQESETP